jgi:hypothetical protein
LEKKIAGELRGGGVGGGGKIYPHQTAGPRKVNLIISKFLKLIVFFQVETSWPVIHICRTE